MSKWAEFYCNRINNPEYETYFKNRYSPFLSLIKETITRYNNITECGCGTGLVSKLIYNPEKNFTIADLDKSMLLLAEQNFKGRILQHNICNKPLKTELLITHGVLEHLSIPEIKRITRTNTSAIHYVPSNKYKQMSFGNEKLLTQKDWQEIARPNRIIEFNQGYDLILIKEE